MDCDGRPALYDRVAARLKEAHALVRRAQVTEEERVALTRRLLVVTAATKHDLADAERRLERLIEEIETRPPRADGHPGTAE